MKCIASKIIKILTNLIVFCFFFQNDKKLSFPFIKLDERSKLLIFKNLNYRQKKKQIEKYF